MTSFKNLRVLVTKRDIPKIAIDLLNAKCEVVLMDEMTRNEFIKQLIQSDGVLISGHPVIDQELIDLIGPRLKVISQIGVGVDHIDVPYVKSKKILIGNTKNTLNECVAEVAIMLALSVAHRLKEALNVIKNEQWSKMQYASLGQEIRNSVVGIIGFGSIGIEIVKRMNAFSPKRVIYHGRTEKSYAKDFNAVRVPLKTLLQESDFVMVCCPLTSETYHLINASSFKIMKSNAILVNVSRGDVINQDNLVTALKEGEIFGAGLDVMTPEPLPKNHPLVEMENCVLSPHIGTATVQTRNDMFAMGAKNLLAALERKPMPSPL